PAPPRPAHHLPPRPATSIRRPHSHLPPAPAAGPARHRHPARTLVHLHPAPQQHPDPHHLTELDHSIADWDLRVDEDRFRRRLNALVQWLHDRDDATPTPPQRSVDIHPPDEDGTACLQLHGPAPEILSLGRRLDSAARPIQKSHRKANANGHTTPFAI